MSEQARPGALRLAAMEGQKRNGSPVRDIQEQLDAALAKGQDADNGNLSLPGVVTDTSLTLPDGLSFEQWQQVGFTLRRVNQAWKWWVGDWLNYGERTYGEMYAQAMDETGLPYHSVAQIAYVARHVVPPMRREGLSWSHHEAVAGLGSAEAEKLLELAEANDWTREMLRQSVKYLKSPAEPEVFPPAGTSLARCECKCCEH